MARFLLDEKNTGSGFELALRGRVAATGMDRSGRHRRNLVPAEPGTAPYSLEHDAGMPLIFGGSVSTDERGLLFEMKAPSSN